MNLSSARLNESYYIENGSLRSDLESNNSLTSVDGGYQYVIDFISSMRPEKLDDQLYQDEENREIYLVEVGTDSYLFGRNGSIEDYIGSELEEAEDMNPAA